MARRLLVLLALAGLAAGCGDSDDRGADTRTTAPGSTTAEAALSKSEYIARRDAICKQYAPELKKQTAALETGEYSGVVAHQLRAIANLLEGAQEKTNEIPFPSGDEEELRKAQATAEQRIVFLDTAAEAIEDRQLRTYRQLVGKVDSANDELKKFAAGYGFKVCGRD